MTRTNEKINQTFKGFLKNDPDKKNPKHGLACEYLFEKLREKQYQKEIDWLKINLRNEYKEVVAKGIKELISKIKDKRAEIVNRIEKLSNHEIEISTVEKPEYEDNRYVHRYSQLVRDIAYEKREIKDCKSRIKTLENNIKQFLECRTEIFRLLSQLKNPIFLQSFKKVIYDKHIIPSKCIEAPINSLTMRGKRTNSVICFADVLIPYSELDYAAVSLQGYNFSDDFKVNLGAHIFYFMEKDTLQIKNLDETFYYFKRYIDKYLNSTLGEVKISKEPAENILQHINQYHEFVNPTQTFVCLDYEDTQLKNLTENSKIKVVKLGPKFIEFCENRPAEEIEEI
tara:strand:- start:61 stop:1083 length:1023 start_codon:yes stop_codon:yes gene_type:complete